MADDISTAVGITIVLFAGVSLVLGLNRQTETRLSIWLRAAEVAGKLGMVGFGILVLLKGISGYEAPVLQAAVLTVLALASITWVLLDRRARSEDKHR